MSGSATNSPLSQVTTVDMQTPACSDCDQSRRESPVGVQHVEWAVVSQRSDQPAILLPDAGWPSQVANGRAEQWIG